MTDKDPNLLEGIKVIEMASYISGPLAGSLLSKLGAEVIKLEHPPTGDPFRDGDPRKFPEPALWHTTPTRPAFA